MELSGRLMEGFNRKLRIQVQSTKFRTICSLSYFVSYYLFTNLIETDFR